MEDHLTPPIELGEEISPLQQQQQSKQYLNVKLNCRGQLRRLQLQECTYHALQQAIKAIFVDYRGGKCFYQDYEGDEIVFCTDSEMATMFNYFKQKWSSDSPRVFVEEKESTGMEEDSFEADPMLLDEIDYLRHAHRQLQRGNGNGTSKNEEKGTSTEGENTNTKWLHANIICDICDGPVLGHRYKCLICLDYDLCEHCERTGHHGEHAMVRLATPQTQKPEFMLRPSSLGYSRFPPAGTFPPTFGHRSHFCPAKRIAAGGQKYKFDPESELANKPMGYEEKRALSLAINYLTADKLTNVVDIISRSEGIDENPNQKEIEIDFEKLKTTTLRELEAFIKAEEEAKNGPSHSNSRHGSKHHRHHSKREGGNEEGNNKVDGGEGNNDSIGEKWAKCQQKWMDKMEKKLAKQEQHYRDRAFRALHRFDHPHRHQHLHHPIPSQPRNDGNNERQQNLGATHNGVEYLKQIGHSLQQALLNFGIDCEATVKDREGNVQGHLPFPNELEEENRLNPMERKCPAGILERQKLASKNGVGKKKCAKEIKLAELREAIQRADHQIVKDKMLRKYADEKEKKKGKAEEKKKTSSSSAQPTPPPTAESQSPPSEQHQNHPAPPSIEAVLQNATKAAIDGFQVASQIASEIISGFDPAAGEHINRFGQNLMDGAKNGAENLTEKILSSPELLQQATAFQSYLEQLKFPPPTQNPTQNSQPPPNGNENSQFPPSPQMPEQIQNLMAQIQNQVENWREMTNQAQNSKEAPNPPKEEEKSKNEESKLSRHFSQMNLKGEELAPAKKEENGIEGKEEEDEQKIDGGRKKEESFSSSDSDVEILNGSEEDEDEGEEDGNAGEELEIEPSLPPSFGSGHSSSLKRKAPGLDHHLEMNKALYDSVSMEMDLSTHTALSVGQNGEQQQGNENGVDRPARPLSASRSSSISSLNSASSNSLSSSDSSGWMVVKKESFKRLCDFYEKRRRLDSPNGHGDSFIAELEKERQEALKQQKEEGNDEKNEENESNPGEHLESSDGKKEEESGQKNEEISVDVEMQKVKIDEEIGKKTMATNQPRIEEEKIVDIDGGSKQKDNGGNNNEAIPPKQQPSNNPIANPLLANLGVNMAGLFDVLMRGGNGGEGHESTAHQQQPPKMEQGRQNVPPFKWNWGAIPMPPPPFYHFKPNPMEIPVFDNGQKQMNSGERTKPMPSAPVAEQMNGGGEVQQNGQKKHSNIYPDLLAASVAAAAGNGVLEELCTAGEPHHHCLRMATTSRHTRQCRWIHPNPDVVEIAKQLTDMGFDNCNGWLYRLAEQHNCVLDRIFEAIEKDNLHKERQFLADN